MLFYFSPLKVICVFWHVREDDLLSKAKCSGLLVFQVMTLERCYFLVEVLTSNFCSASIDVFWDEKNRKAVPD